MKYPIFQFAALVGMSLWTGAGQTMHAQQLRFSQDTLSVGVLSEDDAPATVRFHYTNVSDRPVVITHVESTCSCAQPGFKREPIAPGEEGDVSLTFYPLGRVGNMARSVKLYTDHDADCPAQLLTLTGCVKPSSDPYLKYAFGMGPLRLMQGTVHFGKVRGPQRQMTSVEVVNTGAEPLSLSAEQLPPYLHFSTLPAVIPPGETAELLFIVSPDKMETPGLFNVKFVLNGLGNLPETERTMYVTGKIE